MKLKLCLLAGFSFVGLCLNINQVESNKISNQKDESHEIVIEKDPIVFDGLTEKELIDKIEKSLNDDLKNKSELYVKYSLENGVDPYLAVAISLHETGCKWKCSTLVKKCNNVGGMIGNNKCGDSPYNSFESLDEGIKRFIDNLKNNYISKGLTTPELMNKKYATSKSWASNVNKYIDEIKKS